MLALVLAGCGEWYVGRAGQVIEARVVRVVETGERSFEGMAPQPYQRLEVELEGGLYRGDRVLVDWGGRNALNHAGLLREGDRVLVTSAFDQDGERHYSIAEVVRLPALLPFAGLLALVLLVVARWKGVAAIAGLGGSIAVFLLVVIPSVRAGEDPLVAALIGSVGVLFASVYVVHGFNRKSTAALVGSSSGLVVVVLLASAAVVLAKLTGFDTEEAVFLAITSDGRVDMPKLVLAGVMVGSLGALVDMAVGQASTVFELSHVDRTLRGRRLYASALNVGRDHIGSLINTLALAYFGGTLPLLILFSIGYAPLAVSMNSEIIVGSVVAVLVASIGLVLCVPLTTAVAVWLAGRSP